jgi:S1-C subfamily serine protease
VVKFYISNTPEDKFTADAISQTLFREGIFISHDINDCDAVVLVFTKTANASFQVNREIQTARTAGKIIFPLRIHNVPLNFELENLLHGVVWVETNPYRRDFEELINTVRPFFFGNMKQSPQKKAKTFGARFGVAFVAMLIVFVMIVWVNAFFFVWENEEHYAETNEELHALTPEEIFANSADAVFIVYAYDEYGNRMSSGSGFFVSACGMAVSNHHVLVNAQQITIVTNDDTEFKVEGFYAFDIDNDLAIFQVDGTGFHFLVPGDSSAVQVGESVYAIGSPHGNRNTFSISYVSNLLETLDFNIYRASGVIQITAPLYPGSSGGALINARGEVIAVTSAVDTQRSGVVFAVPISHVNLQNLVPGEFYPLPVTMVSPSHGGHFYYEELPGITDFLSVSANAVLREGESLEFKDFDYDYIFIYDLARRHFVPDTDRFDIILMEQGFAMQEIINGSEETLVYLFNRAENLSVVYTYFWHDEKLVIRIVEGNAFLQRGE